MDILVIVKVKIRVLINWSYVQYLPPELYFLLSMEWVPYFWARSSIFFEHMHFWCSLLKYAILKPHATHIYVLN